MFPGVGVWLVGMGVVRRYAISAALGGSLLGVLGLGLSGCNVLQNLGGGPSNADFTGNYTFTQAPNSSSGQTAGSVVGFVGAVANTGSSFTATLRAVASGGCVSSTENLNFAGTRASSGQITLTSATIASNPITIVWDDDPTQSSNGVGTYAIGGNGPCAMGATQFVSDGISPVTGTYIGTFSSSAGGQATITAALAQGTANADGQFPAAGTLVVSTAACTNNFTVSGIVTGPEMTVEFNPSGSASLGGFVALLPDHVLTLSIPAGISVTGACNPGVFSGVLSKE